MQVTLTGLVFYRQRLYADMALQALYFVAMGYGWWRWLRPGPRRDRLPVTQLRPAVLSAGVAAGLAGTGVWGLVLAATTADAMPYRDAFIAVFGVLSQLLQAHKKIEVWAGWALVNLAGVGVYALLGLYWFTGLYTLYLALSVGGYKSWRHELYNSVQ